MGKKMEIDKITSLSKLWNYDDKIISDAVKVTSTFEEAQELLDIMSSEGFDSLIEAIEWYKELNDDDLNRLDVSNHFNSTELERICKESGTDFNELRNKNID